MKFRINNKKKLDSQLGFRIREFWVKINYNMYNCDTSISLR